ncbi:lysozyme inhibitor LprI family protein [Candidatus Symbiopectobacterium sp. NZEC151]|uniref:lysozyme inhibitor LprI family protein n=2 Tax=unclassified Symbiopectobacterium TaxID=2794573 RepID=UPI0022266433|nr:hypothetical protein [Candidatus Symbiopectobacterium sp. NZEC151]MCW2476033.1 hypothetical protein [Candidatus Symbiopectobacterium sp. NZEC151]
MKLGKIVLFLALLACYANVQAAGFNCSLENLNETEKTICSTPALSGIDSIANRRYTIAIDNSVAKGSLMREQREWLARRNACGTNVDCIKSEYQQQIRYLEMVHQFSSVRNLFGKWLDKPLEKGMKTASGFAIEEAPWKIKRLFRFRGEMRKYDENNDGYWRLLTHRIINGDLAIFFAVANSTNTKIYMYTDSVPHSNDLKLVALFDYKMSTVYTPVVSYHVTDDNILSYSISYGRGDYHYEKQFEIEVSDKGLSAPKEVPATTVRDYDEEGSETWTGYCGIVTCTSRGGSPDGKWRIAATDSIFYFPSDRPDLGVDVFLPQLDPNENKSSQWEYDRRYTWGDKNAFYFDNDGGVACVWKTDIEKKTTTRILPVEGLVHPYYIKYKGKDYIVARHLSYEGEYGNRGSDGYLDGYYIATE